MALFIRGLIGTMVAVAGGDVCGLSMYYLDHLGRWYVLGTPQIVLLVLVSLLLAGAEAAQHPPAQEGTRERFQTLLRQFFFAVFTSLVLTYKPL